MAEIPGLDTDTIVKIVGGVLGGGGAATIVAAWLNRRRVAAEADKTEAEAENIRAAARKLESESDPDVAAIKMLTDLLNTFHAQLGKAEEREARFQNRVNLMDAEISRLRVDNADLKEKVATLQAVVDRHEKTMKEDDPFKEKFISIGGWNTKT